MRVVGSGGRFEVVESSFFECGSVVTNGRRCFFFLVNRVAHSHKICSWMILVCMDAYLYASGISNRLITTGTSYALSLR